MLTILILSLFQRRVVGDWALFAFKMFLLKWKHGFRKHRPATSFRRTILVMLLTHARQETRPELLKNTPSLVVEINLHQQWCGVAQGPKRSHCRQVRSQNITFVACREDRSLQTDLPRTRTWTLRLWRPMPYPLGQQADATFPHLQACP